jgi:phosphatidylinositol kinase/protein kinase (PI-3  family)
LALWLGTFTLISLGDRHGENILYDEKSGECLHVDLNCLFEKGLEFDIPERVPFRLTHNMVDAFGVFGVEGPFRKSCEMVMKVLHDNRELLVSVLETFLHDPLCVGLLISFSLRDADFLGVAYKEPRWEFKSRNEFEYN